MGLKQRDLLSPTLFILAAKVLSRALKSLTLIRRLRCLTGQGEAQKLITFLLQMIYDMIRLGKVYLGTSQRVKSTLEGYELVLWKKVNKGKSAICLHNGVSQGVVVMVEVATSIIWKDFPFTYPGCPIFHIRKKKDYNHHIMNRISSKMWGWKGRMISYRGKAILIKHVLKSIPIHCLSVMNPS